MEEDRHARSRACSNPIELLRPADGADELLADGTMSDNAKRVALRPELLLRLGRILRTHKIDELAPKLESAGIPYAPIVSPEQLIDDPHLRASDGLVPSRRTTEARPMLCSCP
jgi:crotonobetainyl-CoA:carnitine CoA-transferase CaiB-like acyl-CoA transferase